MIDNSIANPLFIQCVTLILGRFAFYEAILGYFDLLKIPFMIIPGP